MLRTVLVAIPELGAGGPDRVIFELLTGLDPFRYRPVLLVSRTGGRYYDRLPAGLAIEKVADERYPVRSFAQAVDRIRPDLILTTLRMNITASAARFFQRWRPPLVIRQANAIALDFAELRKRSLVKHRLAEKVIAWLYRRADGVIAQSQDMAAELRPGLKPGIPLAVIGNPVDIGATVRAAQEQGSIAGSVRFGDPAIVAVGRLSGQKGFDVLIEAFARLLRQRPGAGLTVYGEGADRTALEAQAASLSVTDKVSLVGHSDTLLAAVADADLFVSSSRYEGFSNAILEALALGTPVAATDCAGATREMIDHSVNGVLCAVDDADSLATAMAFALDQDRASLAAASHRHLERQFAKGVILSRYQDFFDRVIAERGAAK